MPRCNYNNGRGRTRFKSCPAGVRFELNDINNNGDGTSETQDKESRASFAKEVNTFVRGHSRRRSLPLVHQMSDDAQRFSSAEPASHGYMQNYSAGGANNVFCCKLAGIVMISCTHSPRIALSLTHQHNDPNISEQQIVLDTLNPLDSCDTVLERVPTIWNSACQPREVVIAAVKGVEKNASSFESLNEGKLGESNWFGLGCNTTERINLKWHLFAGEGFLGELDGVKVNDLDDKAVRLLQHSKQASQLQAECDDEVSRLRCRVYDTELLVESLASQVDATRRELTMSKKKQENELSDLLSLNEEMQSIWTEKESEVREVLERFSAYRDAVTADSREKDEMYAEELKKREVIVEELELEKKNLEKRSSKIRQALESMIEDLKTLEIGQLKGLLAIDGLITDLAKRYKTENEMGAKEICQTIHERLQCVIVEFKEQDFAKYTSHLDVVTGQGHTGSDVSGVENVHTLNECTSSEHYSFVEKEHLLEEDFFKLVKEIEERVGVECEKTANDEEDGLVEAYIERKAVVKLLEEQWTRHQVQCKEKEDEIQHWKRKYKQDTGNLQELLEDQERSELKNHEVASELRVEIEKLRRKMKTLESEVEMAKEQGDDEACVLRENFEKDLSAKLRRQSKSFFSVEEASRSELAELEQENEKLYRANNDLRREIAEHCAEIKSWVTGVLLLTEEEYNEEFGTITGVMTKLQGIIADNKRTITELRDQLTEREDNCGDAGSPTEDSLSHSWGGHSWNSVDSQKDLCRNCRQAKWRRVLMGSFDHVETGLVVKQDEDEDFVAKIDVYDPKYRKKSLKDSLELAEAKTNLIERLGDENWNALGTLGEDSPEGNGSSSGSMVKGCNRSPSTDVERPELPASRVDSGIIDQDYVRANPDEVDGFGRGDSHLYQKVAGVHEDDALSKQADGGKWMKEMVDAGGDEMNKEEDRERGDEGDVVVKWATEQGLLIDMEDYDEMSGEDGDDDVGNDDDHASNRDDADHDNVDDYGEDDVHDHADNNNGDSNDYDCDDDHHVNTNNGDNDYVHDHADYNNNHDDDDDEYLDDDYDDDGDNDLVRVVNLYRSLVIDNYKPPSASTDNYSSSSRTSPSSQLHWSQMNDPIDSFGNQDVEERREPRKVTWDPAIVHNKDINGEMRNNLKEMDSETSARDVRPECSDSREVAEERNSKQLEMEEDDIPAKELGSSGILQLSESMKYTNSGKSLDEIPGNAQDGNVCIAQSCSHCSRILAQNAEAYEKAMEKLLELKSQQAMDREVLRELDATKAEVLRQEQQYGELQRVCEDYLNRIDECSEKMKSRSTELRRLKLNNNVIKTEVEWLRQALGITRDYSNL